MKHLLLIIALSAGSAQAATYYRDRYIPMTNSPCVVQWNENVNINSGMIAYMDIGEREVWKRDGTFSDPRLDHKYMSFRITLIGGANWEKKGTRSELEKIRADFLKQIKDCGAQ